MIFRIKNTLLLLFLSIFSINSLLPMRLPNQTSPMAGDMNGQMKLTKEDMELLEEISKLDDSELKYLWEEVILPEVDKMTEEQKNQFWQDVEQTAQMLEEEITKVIQEEQAKKAEEEEEEPVVPIIETTPTVTTATDKDLKDVANVIGSLIDKIESYLRKAQIIPKFGDKVEQWGKARRITDWQTDATWNKLHADIDFMKSKLYLIGERDPKTNEYKHLQNILDDESLYNNLSQLNRKLTQFEPQISAPEPGQQKLTKESKNAIEKVTSALTETLYVLKLSAALEQVIQKYEKRAQELTKKQEAAEKKAAQELKKPTLKRPAQVIGRAEKVEFEPYVAPTYEGFEPYTPEPYEPPKKETTPTTTPKIKPKAPAEKKKPEAPKTPAKKPEVPEDKFAQSAIDAFVKSLGDAELTDSKISNMSTQIKTVEKKDMSKAITNASAKIRRAANHLKSLKQRKLKPAQRKKYYTDVKSYLETYRPELRRVSGQAQKAKATADAELGNEIEDLIESISYFNSAIGRFK